MTNILQKAEEPKLEEASSDQNDMMEKLNAAFVDLYDRPNIYTISEFQTYIPLFNTELSKTYDQNTLIKLSQTFFAEINPYKEIHIFQSKNDTEPVTKLPPLFVQASSMPNTEESEVISGKNAKMGGHDIPKYASAALKPFVQLLMGAQNTDQHIKTLKEQRRIYRETMSAFYGAKETEEKVEEDPPVKQEIDDVDDWDLE